MSTSRFASVCQNPGLSGGALYFIEAFSKSDIAIELINH